MRLLRILSGIFEPKRAFEADTDFWEILLALVLDGSLVGLWLSLSLAHRVFLKVVVFAIPVTVLAWAIISAILWILARIRSKIKLYQVLRIEGIAFQALIPCLVLLTPYTNAYGLDISRYGGGILYPLSVSLLILSWALSITYLGFRHFKVSPRWSLGVLIAYMTSIVLGAEIFMRYLSAGHFSIFDLLRLA